MMRWVFLAALLSLPVLTDVIVDYQFRHQTVGYSQENRGDLDGRNERLRADAKRQRVLAGTDEPAAIRYLVGDGE